MLKYVWYLGGNPLCVTLFNHISTISTYFNVISTYLTWYFNVFQRYINVYSPKFRKLSPKFLLRHVEICWYVLISFNLFQRYIIQGVFYLRAQIRWYTVYICWYFLHPLPVRRARLRAAPPWRARRPHCRSARSPRRSAVTARAPSGLLLAPSSLPLGAAQGRAHRPLCRWRHPASRRRLPLGQPALVPTGSRVALAGLDEKVYVFYHTKCPVAWGGGSRGGAPPHTARSRRLAGRRSGARGGSRDPCPLLPTVGDIMRTASNCQVAKSSMLSSNLAKRHIRKTALNIKIKLSSRLRRERLKSHPLHAQGPHHRIARGSCRKHRRPKRTQG